jgi:magnesium chelatase family protein
VLAIVPSATLHGLDGRFIRVEVDVAPGLPGFTIVGLADAALQEARERVRGALRNAGYVHPPRRITVNLAPADLRKAGASLDLAMAIGILLGSEQVRSGGARVAMIGELSLGGEVRSVPGVLPMVAALARRGLRRVVVAAAAVDEARLVDGIEVAGVETLDAAVEIIRARRGHRTVTAPSRIELVDPGGRTGDDGPAEPSRRAPGVPGVPGIPGVPDLGEVRGQVEARRGLEIALAGGHGLLLIGPPGSGKTLLARSLPSILPRMILAEALDVTRIYSVADMLPGDTPLIRQRPFRAPHHTISQAGLVGGGHWPRPGEISLAHRGVLFLDELPEFGQHTLEVLRQPLEDKIVTISRAQGSLTFPANFMLVGAMNPCP